MGSWAEPILKFRRTVLIIGGPAAAACATQYTYAVNKLMGARNRRTSGKMCNSEFLKQNLHFIPKVHDLCGFFSGTIFKSSKNPSKILLSVGTARSTQLETLNYDRGEKSLD